MSQKGDNEQLTIYLKNRSSVINLTLELLPQRIKSSFRHTMRMSHHISAILVKEASVYHNIYIGSNSKEFSLNKYVHCNSRWCFSESTSDFLLSKSTFLQEDNVNIKHTANINTDLYLYTFCKKNYFDVKHSDCETKFYKYAVPRNKISMTSSVIETELIQR